LEPFEKEDKIGVIVELKLRVVVFFAAQIKVGLFAIFESFFKVAF
jgi:hypothetical protein